MATLKQKKAFQEVGVNGGIITKAMVAAGYSQGVAKRTDKLTGTKGWAELMDKFLSDKKLAAVHNKLLEKKEVIVVSDGAKDGSHYEFTEQPHSDAAKALDMAYKLKKKYPKEDGGFTGVIVVNVSGEGAKKYGIRVNEPNETAITNP